MISGGILAFPTDTVFGLGCIIDKKAIAKIYKAKGRDFNKALPMMASGLEMIKRYAYIDYKAEKLIKHFMPGAITIVFKKREEVNLYNDKDTIAIRVPDDEWILSLIDELDMPLLVTSANISGEGSLLKWEDVYESMKNKIDGIILEDAKGSISSTIVDISNNKIEILREGPISYKEIEEVWQ